MLSVDYIVNSIFNSRTYILHTPGEKECFLVDCGDVKPVVEGGWKVNGVLLTHVHFDHIYGLNELLEVFPSANVFTNASGRDALSDPRLNMSHYHPDAEDFVVKNIENVRTVTEGDIVRMTGGTAIVLETPGHDPSCLCYKVEDMLFTGDSYIPGLKVVTTFPHSDRRAAEVSRKRILEYGNGLTILPGHEV